VLSVTIENLGGTHMSRVRVRVRVIASIERSRCF
jgi:hypothetical protein